MRGYKSHPRCALRGYKSHTPNSRVARCADTNCCALRVIYLPRYNGVDNANFGNFDLPLLKKCQEFGHRPTRSNPRALRALVRARFADEGQMQLVPAPKEKRKITPHLLHGAPGTGLPLPGVWCVGCPSWVRSIGPVRRCVGVYGRAGVEKSTKIRNFGLNLEHIFAQIFTCASRVEKLK